MGAIHGKDGYLMYNSVNISPWGTEVTLTIDGDTAETSTFGDAAKEYVKGLYDWKISASGIWSGTAAEIDATLAPDAILTTARAVVFRANSAARGAANPEYTGNVFLTSYEVAPSLGDAVTWSAEFQGTGALGRSVTP